MCKRADEFTQRRSIELITSARDANRTPSGRKGTTRCGCAGTGHARPGVTSKTNVDRSGVSSQNAGTRWKNPKGSDLKLKFSRSCRTWFEFIPETPVELNARMFAIPLRSAPRGSAAGPGGCTYGMLQVRLDDVELLQMLASAAEDFARGAVPRVVFRSFPTSPRDGTAEERWGCAWDSLQNVIPKVGGDQSGVGGTSLRPFPICLLNEGRLIVWGMQSEG